MPQGHKGEKRGVTGVVNIQSTQSKRYAARFAALIAFNQKAAGDALIGAVRLN